MAEPTEGQVKIRLNGFIDESDKALFEALNAMPSPRNRMRRFRDLANKGLLYEQLMERGEAAVLAPQRVAQAQPLEPIPAPTQRSVTSASDNTVEKRTTPERKKGSRLDMSMLDLVNTGIMRPK